MLEVVWWMERSVGPGEGGKQQRLNLQLQAAPFPVPFPTPNFWFSRTRYRRSVGWGEDKVLYRVVGGGGVILRFLGVARASGWPTFRVEEEEGRGGVIF